MVTIKSYTDIEQSRKLAKILPLESADYYHATDAGVVITAPYITYCGEERCIPAYNGAVPCWSLAALLEILDYPQLSKDKLGDGKVGWMVSVYPNDCRYDSCWHDNPVDACYEMIIRLNELKML